MNSYFFRIIFSNFLLVIGLYLVIKRLYWVMALGGHPWASGEWLINYSSGFIRRGLFGTLILALTRDPEIILLLLFLFNVVLFFAVWSFFYWGLIVNKFSWISMLLVLNPAGVLFIAWDENLFIRKELIGLICVIMLVVSQKLNLCTKTIIFFGSILYVVSLFIGEINLFYLPAVIYLILKSNLKYFRAICIVLVAFSAIIAFLLSINFNGNYEISQKICDDLEARGFQDNKVCTGAILSLGIEFKEALMTNQSNLKTNLLFILVFIAVISPILYFSEFNGKFRPLFLSVFCIAPLFFIAWDYGRWIFMIYTLYISLILPSNTILKSQNRFIGIFVVVFTLSFGFAHTGGNPIDNGWIGALPSLLKIAF